MFSNFGSDIVEDADEQLAPDVINPRQNVFSTLVFPKIVLRNSPFLRNGHCLTLLLLVYLFLPAHTCTLPLV
jgi:hypothetical protein